MKTHAVRAITAPCLAASLAAVVAGCGPSGTESGQPGDRVYRVEVASYAPDAGADRLLEGLFAGLEKAGFVRGQNLDTEHKMAGGDMANIPMLLQSLDSANLDLIVTLTTPVLAGACKIVRNTPVVFCYVTDPIAAGAGTTFSDNTAAQAFSAIGTTAKKARLPLLANEMGIAFPAEIAALDGKSLPE